ncbi:MAG: adenylate/guanylate cyclase domain-containing protein [Xanthobacteraceae bacterium]|nr:adenylate/guanylate cyclase domain-containing protein [Xanthobacteraceae bacterium]
MERRDLIIQEPKRVGVLPAWLERLMSVGIVSNDPDVVRRQRCVNVGAFVTSANAGSHLVFNSFYDFWGLLPLHVYNAILVVLPLLVPRLHRYGENAGAIALALLLIFAHMLVVWAMGIASDLHVYYTFAGAFLLLIGVQHWRLFLIVFAFCLAALLFALNFAPIDGIISPDDRQLRELLSTHAMVNTITINAIVIFYALSGWRRDMLMVEHLRARSDALIAAVMPAPIAERLKSGEEHIADRIETLSVMFADLVGFTESVHQLPPEEVVDFLDRLVRAFDGLSERFGVEKIKTIGDSYMAAAGFDGRAAEGAIATGRLALAMLDAIGRQPPLGGRAPRLRIGIHCGPATAGVIGDTRFSYDVWGDAVNMAARMESNGEPGKIHVSESFRSLTLDRFEFEDGGTVELKGIGTARSYFLLREKQ